MNQSQPEKAERGIEEIMRECDVLFDGIELAKSWFRKQITGIHQSHHQELQKARVEEREKARNLYQGLQMMFDQYYPKGDHQFITAGETAEELLNMYTDLQCDCEEAPEQQEWDGHTRYCKALDQSELDELTEAIRNKELTD